MRRRMLIQGRRCRYRSRQTGSPQLRDGARKGGCGTTSTRGGDGAANFRKIGAGSPALLLKRLKGVTVFTESVLWAIKAPKPLRGMFPAQAIGASQGDEIDALPRGWLRFYEAINPQSSHSWQPFRAACPRMPVCVVSLSLAVLFAFPTTLAAQTQFQSWVTRYNGPAARSNRPSALVGDGAGAIIVAGSSRNASGNDDLLVTKLDEGSGALLWGKALRWSRPCRRPCHRPWR